MSSPEQRPPVKLQHVELSHEDVLRDYREAARSRQASLIGRREVMSGKAKFGIFGDGKEVAQLAWARAARPGDFRSGYYRDQTLMFALYEAQIREFFAQLYAHADVEHEPMSAGRSMNSHFATRMLDSDGKWTDLTLTHNSASDISPTGSQLPRLVGLAYASRLYRELDELRGLEGFSDGGDEVAWGTVGNATCAEGMVWESINAIGVLKAPAVISIWDDGYGISVPNEYQVTKSDLSVLLSGFAREPGLADGYDLHTVKGWDYPALVEVYQLAGDTARREHVPQIVHVTELTQPQGHSTSGSHERYKSKERLAWEREFDCIYKMRQWILNQGIASAEELDRIDDDARQEVEAIREEAWEAFQSPIRQERNEVVEMLDEILATAEGSSTGSTWDAAAVTAMRDELAAMATPLRRDVMVAAHDTLFALRHADIPAKEGLVDWRRVQEGVNLDRYGSHLYSQSDEAAALVPAVEPAYGDDPPMATGFEVLNACFDAMLERDPRFIAFGEDVGRLGDVNQAFRGLQEKHGELRVSDTGIRECTIVGQAIGMAMRGLRPLAEIQYLDYLLYALQLLSDDLATLHWRTKGGQKAPVIVRTRGHRLEGTWHAGSPMAGIINLVRGMHVLVPRDMTRAAGFYNTLLQSDEPGLVVEVLNGYRLREPMPSNIGSLTVPVGVPEVLLPGRDVTVVTYGACCRVALAAADTLGEAGIDVEVIDVQSLLPFDRDGAIVRSLERTGRIVFLDEDVPGGTTAFMMREVIERQGGYRWLDSEPRTLSAKAHRTAYGTDGDYWSKPNAEHVVLTVYELMHEVDPRRFPAYVD
ncbi:MAG: thiamine pyrophosphate-dependent enzyme [Anaerolineae bacterium]|jgi:pyruvate/2-oxoglutarate/acetoin dehydrogenase E1 component/TPP-dependent pyruvate/acetoin dehydrogenase alpha subunit